MLIGKQRNSLFYIFMFLKINIQKKNIFYFCQSKAPVDDWITKKDPAVEKREAEEAKKKATAALQKEKEAVNMRIAKI